MTETARLGITQVEQSQTNKEVVINEAVSTLEMFATRLIVLSKGDNAPAGGEVDGDAYLVGSSGTGAFLGHDDELALRINGAWEFIVPKEGFEIEVEDEDTSYILRGGSWVDQAGGGAIEVLDEGVSETAALVSLDFTGAGVSASDDGSGNVTVTVSGGGGGLSLDGAKVRKSATLTAQNFTGAGAAVTFNTEDWDTGGYHDNVSNTDRLTPPSAGYYRCTAQLTLQNVTSGSFVIALIRRYNSSNVQQEAVAEQHCEVSFTGDIYINLVGTSNFASGDFARMFIITESDNSVDITTDTWFEISKVG